MLTIKGTRGSKLILGIPNNNVRKQYYGYLEEEYQAKSYVDTNRLTDYYYDMAYDGVWEEGLRFMFIVISSCCLIIPIMPVSTATSSNSRFSPERSLMKS